MLMLYKSSLINVWCDLAVLKVNVMTEVAEMVDIAVIDVEAIMDVIDSYADCNGWYKWN